MQKLFTKEHEWVRVEGKKGVVGITEYAQKQLGDIVSVELPKIGDKAVKGKTIAIIDSMKASADVYAPFSGEVVEINEALLEKPELVNSSPENEGWFVVLTIEDEKELATLLDEQSYRSYVSSLQKK